MNSIQILDCTNEREVTARVDALVDEMNIKLQGKVIDVRIIAHRNYGRIYLRWKGGNLNKVVANYKKIYEPVDQHMILLMAELQGMVDVINSHIALQRKKQRA